MGADVADSEVLSVVPEEILSLTALDVRDSVGILSFLRLTLESNVKTVSVSAKTRKRAEIMCVIFDWFFI